jgi:hypothetical protein
MELAVSHKDVRKARSFNKELPKNVKRLQEELAKKLYLAQANLRKLTDSFREKTKVEIEVATATALQGWSEQAAELQVLRAQKANRKLRGPGFWKLDKANCEAVEKNLTTDFIRIALTHREEITKLLERHEEQVRTMHVEIEAVAEPVIVAAQETEAPEEAADLEEDDSAEPSILHVLNKE